jgi:hypothetical protein
MKDRKVKQVFLGVGTSWGIRASGKADEGEYGGYILYSYMKIE